MGIADVRNALQESVRSVGSASGVRLSYRGGGTQQVISFKLSANNVETNHELVLPGDAPLIPALKSAAEIFVANLTMEG
jgi:hypothetical protein